MSDASFAAELRSVSAKAQAEAPSAEITERELVALESAAKKTAMCQAQNGHNEAFILLDRFERLDEKNKNTQLACNKIPAFERAMKRLGLGAVFCNDMYCGMCNMKDCSPGEHYGYKISW